MAVQDAEPKQHSSGLNKGAISTFGIVILVLAAASPLIGLTGAMPLSMLTGTGLGAPGAYVVVGVILLVFSVGFVALSHHVRNAGALYAYVGRGLGLPMGLGAAGLALWAYTTIQVAVYAFFGVVASGTLSHYTGIELPWYVLSIALIVLVQIFGYLHLEIGARVLLVLMALEWGIMILLAIVIAVKGGAGEGYAAADVWSPSAVFAPANVELGLGGIAVAMIWAFASMFGFESSAIYGEEAKDPKKSVSRAAVISVITITLFFAFTGWMAIVGYGPSKAMDAVVASVVDSGDPAQYIFALGDMYLGSWAPVLMSLFVITSMFACVLAFHNGIVRYQYRLGADGVLPKALSRTRQNGAPHVSSIVQCITALIFIIIAVIVNADPVLVLFTWGGGIAVIGVIALYILTSISIIVFFRKNKNLNSNIFTTLLIPIVGLVLLLIAEYLMLQNFYILLGFTPEQSGNALLIAATCILAFAIGLVLWGVRRSSMSKDALKDLEEEIT